MKKTLSILLLWLCAIGALAQHPTFLGVSMGESFTKIDSQLSHRKFLYISTEQFGYKFMSKYRGTFATIKDCEVNMVYSGFSTKPITISVKFPASSDSTMTLHFYDTLLATLTDKYGEPQMTTKDSEELFYESNKVANFCNGAVRLSISGFKGYYYPYLVYLDGENATEHTKLVQKYDESHKSTLDDL